VAKTSNAVLLSAIDSFAQKNGLVKDRFKADDEDPNGGGGGGGSHRPEGKRSSVMPSWSEGLKANRGDGPPKEDVVLSPPDDALLKELEAPSSPEGGDWLEDAVNVPQSTDAVDDLDVVIVANPETTQGDPAEVTQIFHRPEDDLFGPNGSDAAAEMGGGRKPTLPGLPSSSKRNQKSLPPPLPGPEGSRPGRKP
jgi:hypothetical protein